jgi:hypothetical protein
MTIDVCQCVEKAINKRLSFIHAASRRPAA